MAANGTFQLRVSMAIRKTANYWDQFPLDQVSKFNVANKKRKEFARQVLLGGANYNIGAYTQYLLSQYNDENPDVIGEPDLNAGQLSDTAITDSPASASTYDFFSGVEPNDDVTIVTF